ncbi:hypothetical protein [Terrisporobacter sp.]
MLDDIEFIYRILFLVLSIFWAGNILLFRSERQMVINPLLIIIASILVFLPSTNNKMFGVDIEDVKSTLYIAYYIIVIWGMVVMRRKTDLF